LSGSSPKPGIGIQGKVGASTFFQEMETGYSHHGGIIRAESGWGKMHRNSGSVSFPIKSFSQTRIAGDSPHDHNFLS
jgi:hypothetical protein